jgi:large subunit ribosomal protein L14e
MTQVPIAVGRVVRSKAGRDKGRFFLVVGVADEEHLLIADGDLRKLEKPKKKKLKHLAVTAMECECPDIDRLRNATVRKLIQNATGKEG